MTLRPCLSCGTPSDGPRCDEHTLDTKAHASARGYDWQWTKLSRRARKLQPFCTDCGNTENLTGDHSPEAWARKAAGKPIRLQDIDVVCGPCNQSRGAARGHSATRGDAPDRPKPDPLVRPSLSLTPRGPAC